MNYKMRVILIATLLPCVAIGCGGGTPTQRPGSGLPQTPIPNDVVYSIVDTKTEGDTRRFVDVRINRKVAQDVLRSIAFEIKNAAPDRYKSACIGFYLPEMKVNAGSWASAVFDPELTLTIHGITKDQETQMLSKPPLSQSSNIIGRWLQEEDPFPGKITLVSDATGIYMEKIYQDGNTGKESMVERPNSAGRKFMKTARMRPENDYYLIDPSGNLQIWSQDIDGRHVLVVTAKRID